MLSGKEIQQLPAAKDAFRCAEDLVSILQKMQGTEEYKLVTALGASSCKIQSLIGESLKNRGYSPEVRSTFGLAGFRPDFIKEMDDDGVMVEVERGKTIDNNMDMLDFWKCHIHPGIHHLILVVPVWYSTQRSVKANFSSVCRRMAPMFEAANLTNVWTLNVVGY